MKGYDMFAMKPTQEYNFFGSLPCIDKFKNDIPHNNKDNYGKNFMQSQYS